MTTVIGSLGTMTATKGEATSGGRSNHAFAAASVWTRPAIGAARWMDRTK
jgi:hypothetical protein